MEVYLVIDDYTPDAGSTIYGIYKDLTTAEKVVEILGDDDGPYGNANSDGTIEIRSITVEKEVRL